MSTTSIYVRPKRPRPIIIQARDRAVLAEVFRHRYLTAEHLRALVFSQATLRAVNRRLRALWEHRFLAREWLPFVLGRPGTRARRARPLYCLDRRGAALIRDELGLAPGDVPKTRAENARGFATLKHHLVATDFLVSLTVATRKGPLALVEIEREEELRSRAGRLPGRGPSVMSDGAVTLRYGDGRVMTFHLEVVRAATRSGNASIKEKLERYVAFHHQGGFRRVFGHERVRAVLFATTTPERAEHFRALAATLRHGQRLFWFGAYPRDKRGTVPETTFTLTTVLSPMWRVAGDEAPFSLAHPDRGGPHA